MDYNITDQKLELDFGQFCILVKEEDIPHPAALWVVAHCSMCVSTCSMGKMQRITVISPLGINKVYLVFIPHLTCQASAFWANQQSEDATIMATINDVTFVI